MSMLEQVIQLVTILFLLSMVSERISDFLKHYLCGSDVFKIGDTITKSEDDDKEQARVYRILKINVWSGIIIAAILKADIIVIFNHITEAGKTIGWSYIENYSALDKWLLVPGIVLTGCFISFGSKFWHDSLDLLYQIKNTKRLLNDPQTFQVDNVKSLEKLFNTYQSDFIKAAYLEAKTKYMAMASVKAIAIKSNEAGYYFEITVNAMPGFISPFHIYLLEDGTPQQIPIKVIMLPASDPILAHQLDLSDRIFDLSQPSSWGTMGVLVRPLDELSPKRFLLTCCHNVIKPLKDLPYHHQAGQNTINAASTVNGQAVRVGTVIAAHRDHEMDAALIEIDPLQISNFIPKNGIPNIARELVNKDRNILKAFLAGNTSGAQEGTVTAIYNEIKITYASQEEFTIVDTISISNNGLALTQGGDSGACVVDANRNVIGLVVAGNSKSTYVMPINRLLAKLEVQLI